MDEAQRTAWLEKRRVSGFGGSDAAAALGLSKFRSVTELYLDKRAEVPIGLDSEWFHWRREMEDPILRAYSKRTGYGVVRPDDIVVSQKYPWMFTTYDGLVLDGDRAARVVQAKTAGSREGWGEPGSDDVPDDYYFQVQHEMVVAEAPVADIPVLFGFSRLEIYTVDADPVIQADIIEQERLLWERIKAGVPPDVSTYADAVARWGRESRLGKTIADVAVRAAVAEIRSIKTAAEELDARVEAAKLVVMQAMQLNETLVTPDGEILLTWKAQRGKATFDAKKCEAEYPEAFRACAGRGQPFRKMLIKDEK